MQSLTDFFLDLGGWAVDIAEFVGERILFGISIYGVAVIYWLLGVIVIGVILNHIVSFVPRGSGDELSRVKRQHKEHKREDKE